MAKTQKRKISKGIDKTLKRFSKKKKDFEMHQALTGLKNSWKISPNASVIASFFHGKLHKFFFCGKIALKYFSWKIELKDSPYELLVL